MKIRSSRLSFSKCLWAFDARQKLDLPVKSNSDRLPAYLLEEERVVGAMLDPSKLTPLGPSKFRYVVTSFNVFQLQVNPIVSIGVISNPGKLSMHITESQLDGLGFVDDFELTLEATLEATSKGLEGEALLGVSVSRPALLRLVPTSILESTGHSILNGILLGIKARVGKQLVEDFEDWCYENE